MAEDRQQSHHCGIETKLRERRRLLPGQQQSHHCGIETCISKGSTLNKDGEGILMSG